MKKFACFLIAALFALTAFATLGACGKTSVDAEEIPVDVNLDVNTSATLKMGIMDDASEKKPRRRLSTSLTRPTKISK